MKMKNFLAATAKVAFSLAAVVMMSAAFIACSKESGDDPKPNPNAELPVPKPQTVTLDGVEKPILRTKCKDYKNGHYTLYLILSEDKKEFVDLYLTTNYHFGKTIDLSQREPYNKFENFWMISYTTDGDHTSLIYTDSFYENYPIFFSGTLTASGDPKDIVSIELRNGRVIKSGDGKEHTLTLNYVGKMMEIISAWGKSHHTGAVDGMR